MYGTPRDFRDPTPSQHIGLGWITEVISAGVDLGTSVFGGGGSMSSGDYYPAVKRGVLLCPGPYDISTVARAIEANPAIWPDVDAALSLDKAWTRSDLYGPLSSLSTRQKASALVNWAHGGRDCVAKSDETGAAASSSVIQKALRAVGAAGSATPQPAGVPETDSAPVYTTMPVPAPSKPDEPMSIRVSDLALPLGIAGAAALFLAMRNN